MRKGSWLGWIGGIWLLALAISTAGAQQKPIVFADLSWDSIQVHNRIAMFIIENGLGHPTDTVSGETVPMVNGLIRGDLDVDMESWTQNIQGVYDKGIQSGDIIDLGPNYPDSWQGWLVPTYVIQGDAERGIAPMAPELKSVTQMPEYWELFKDPQSPDKGRFYNAIPGWAVTAINAQKLKAYGLDEHYTNFTPGSDAALAGSMVAAYKKGEPWFGYYWAPTWILGKLDMTPLAEPPYAPTVWQSTKACAFPSVEVNILVHKSLPERAPDVVTFLKKYQTTAEVCNRFLAHMEESQASTQETALWFLSQYEDLWTQWVETAVADRVKAALK